MGLYKKCAQGFGWSPKDMDETDFDTLVEFVWYSDTSVKVIGGKEYKRASKCPSWL